MPEGKVGIGPGQAVIKRGFDFVCASLGLVLTSWLLVIGWVIASLDTRSNGLYLQRRVGRHGRMFNVLKLRTMRTGSDSDSTVTVGGDPRITRFGRILRKTKVDELPQLINVVIGNMSFVGPRPDVAGYADRLKGEDRVILELRPGITGPATLEYRDEEEILANADDPIRYNDEVLWPRKVEINKHYYYNYSFWKDIGYIVATIVPQVSKKLHRSQMH